MLQKPGWGIANGCLSNDFTSYSDFVQDVQRTLLADEDGPGYLRRFFG